LEYQETLLGNLIEISSKRSAYRILVGKSQGERQLRRPSHGFKDNIKMDLREIIGVELIQLAQYMV
jgi:hypothetical protein